MSAHTARLKREWLERRRLRLEMEKNDPEPVDEPEGPIFRAVVSVGPENFQIRLSRIMLEVAGATGSEEVAALDDSQLRLMIECVNDFLETSDKTHDELNALADEDLAELLDAAWMDFKPADQVAPEPDAAAADRVRDEGGDPVEVEAKIHTGSVEVSGLGSAAVPIAPPDAPDPPDDSGMDDAALDEARSEVSSGQEQT